MYHDRITLSGQEIYEADFKIDAKGYSMQEVDKLLDIISLAQFKIASLTLLLILHPKLIILDWAVNFLLQFLHL